MAARARGGTTGRVGWVLGAAGGVLALVATSVWWPSGLRAQNVAARARVRPTAAQGFPRAARSAEQARHERELMAYRFAPVFVQDLSPEGWQPTAATRRDGRAFEDYFLRVNFDGDEELGNNAAHLATHCRPERPDGPCDRRGFVYYAVQETEPNGHGLSHFFLHYAYYHPRDPKRLRGHAHDFEGALVVVERDPQGAERVLSVAAQAHDAMPARSAARLVFVDDNSAPIARDDRRPHMAGVHVVLRSQVGHGCGLLEYLPGQAGHGTEFATSVPNAAPQAIVYSPAPDPERVPTQPDPPRPATARYRLISLTNDTDGDGQPDTDADGDEHTAPSGAGLWDRRRDVSAFGASTCLGRREGDELVADDRARDCTHALAHGLQGGECGANLPWGWKLARGQSYRGGLFLEPRVHARYLRLPTDVGVYAFDRQRGSTPGHVYRARLLAELGGQAAPHATCACRETPTTAWCRGVPSEPPRCRSCTPFTPDVRRACPVLRDGWLPDLGLSTCPRANGPTLVVPRPLRLVLARASGQQAGEATLASIEDLPAARLAPIPGSENLVVRASCSGRAALELTLAALCRTASGQLVDRPGARQAMACDRTQHSATLPRPACPQATELVMLSLNEATTGDAPPDDTSPIALHSIEGAGWR